ncbi:MAG: ABC transporter permease subunit [Holosporales bacterium]|jgi:putrescine transport system permease protein|nr:ABC transporter permease subunit [Holosporales bacterium]
MKLGLAISTFYETARQRLIQYHTNIIETGGYITILPLIWVLLFLAIPFTTLLKIGFSEPTFTIPPFSEMFSHVSDYAINIKLNLKNYVTILNTTYYISAFLNSVGFGVIAVVLCLILGFPMAYGIHSVTGKFAKMMLIMLISLSFWTSFLVRIYALINMLNVHGIINSALMRLGLISTPIQFIGNNYAVCAGLVFCYIPFMIFPIYAILEKIDKTYIESANDLGCTPLRAFWYVTVPLSKAGILNGCIMVFTMSSGEFVIPELLGSSDVVTFGRALWTEFFTNLDWPMACSLSILMVMCITLPIMWISKEMSK